MSLPDVSTGNAKSNALPAWISSGVIGIALGAGAAVLVMQSVKPPTKSTGSASPPAMAGGGAPMGMGGGGGGGGGGANGKRALTTLVGKLELLSRKNLKLHVDLSDEQAKTIAAKLEEFDKSETMTADEAQASLDSLEALLTEDQKDAVNAIGLPFGGGGRGGRGGGGGGAPAGSSAPAMGGGAPGGGNPNENPFSQEANQKRLRDLLTRIAPSTVEAGEKSSQTP